MRESARKCAKGERKVRGDTELRSLVGAGVSTGHAGSDCKMAAVRLTVDLHALLGGVPQPMPNYTIVDNGFSQNMSRWIYRPLDRRHHLPKQPKSNNPGHAVRTVLVFVAKESKSEVKWSKHCRNVPAQPHLPAEVVFAVSDLKKVERKKIKREREKGKQGWAKRVK